MEGRTTIERFIVEQQQGTPAVTGELAAVLADLVSAFKAIAAAVGKAGIAGLLGDASSSNASGEPQKRLDVVANELLLRICERSGHLAGVASEELDEVHLCRADRSGAPYVLAVDPLDGSSNLDVNVSVGTIFSVLRRRAGGPLHPGELLQGLEQVCAGYAIYGPAPMLVLTVGRGVHGFTLDRELGELVLTHPALRIPAEAREFAVNASNERFWEPPIRRYVSECLAGRSGPRGDDFNMRWIASLVAEVHRILVRGGVFMYPRDTKLPARPGRLRLLYEARPMAMLVEQAGGVASTGRERLLDVEATELHQRVPVILGSRAEVDRITRYHREHDENGQPFRDPLFNVRTLLRG
jgi:fructose-1,6-bisphosphatase I/sedoheptulose-1,7-bisphosphatase/fructose-1,6-bisphosphatase I